MHIEYYGEFIVLAEELNFHAAAERLHVSQSALSKHIAELERHHHIRLFERDRASVRLTAQGAVFLEQAIRLNDLHEELLGLFAANAKGDRPLNISGVMDSPLDFPLVSRAFEHCRTHGLDQLPVFLPCDSTALVDQIELLRQGKADCALILMPDHLAKALAADGEFATRILWRIPMDAVVRRSHPLAQRSELSLEDLAGETIIRLVGMRFTTAWTTLEEQLADSDVALKVKLMAVSSAYDYITADPGDALLPVQRAPRFADPIQNGNAVRIPLNDTRFTLPLTAIYPVNAAMAALDVLFECLEEAYREGFDV